MLPTGLSPALQYLSPRYAFALFGFSFLFDLYKLSIIDFWRLLQSLLLFLFIHSARSFTNLMLSSALLFFLLPTLHCLERVELYTWKSATIYRLLVIWLQISFKFLRVCMLVAKNHYAPRSFRIAEIVWLGKFYNTIKYILIFMYANI